MGLNIPPHVLNSIYSNPIKREKVKRRRGMTGKKSVEEMKGRKEANHLRNLLCLFPSKLNIFGGGKKKVGFTYNFNYFPRLTQLKFNEAMLVFPSFLWNHHLLKRGNLSDDVLSL
jgi:hypothetical protein